MAKHLQESGVQVKDYTALLDDIKTLAQAHTKLWADPTKASLYPICFQSAACSQQRSAEHCDGRALLWPDALSAGVCAVPWQTRCMMSMYDRSTVQ